MENQLHGDGFFFFFKYCGVPFVHVNWLMWSVDLYFWQQQLAIPLAGVRGLVEMGNLGFAVLHLRSLERTECSNTGENIPKP